MTYGCTSLHVQDGLVDFQKHTIVQLLEAEKLEHLTRFWAELDDADNAHHKQQLGLGLHKEISLTLGLSAQLDELFLVISILLVVLVCAALELTALQSACRKFLFGGLLLLFSKSSVALDLKLQLLWHSGTFCHNVLRYGVTFSH